MAGCLIVVLFSCYVWLLAERGRRYLVGRPDQELQTGGKLRGTHSTNTTQSDVDSRSMWMDLVTNFSIIIFTFLCYDLFVLNILLFVLATDCFFSRPPSRAALSGMACILVWAAWSETR